MQVHARVCKENKLEEKYDCSLKYFVVKGLNFKGCKLKTGELMELKFTITTLYNINRGVGRGGSKGLDEPLSNQDLFQKQLTI